LVTSFKIRVKSQITTGEQFPMGKIIICRMGVDINHNFIPFFSFITKIPIIWGWATWRRAWKYYAFTPAYGDAEKKQLRVWLPNPADWKYWDYIFHQMQIKPIDTWDYQWIQTSFLNQMLHILPQKNLVSNIGLQGAQTHHFTSLLINSSKKELEVLEWPIKHPPIIETGILLDRQIQSLYFERFTFYKRFKRLIKSLFR
jgi:hypothetical protein